MRSFIWFSDRLLYLMNAPEKIAQTYLRLNGFFAIPHFSVLSKEASHIDLLAVRLGKSEEKIGAEPEFVSLRLDERLFNLLGISKDDTVGLVVEVKGGENEHGEISREKFDYAALFFGDLRKVFRVVFERSVREFHKRGNYENRYFVIPIICCMEFIENRFKEMKEIELKLKRTGVLSKQGSWYLSEEFLSELIYLRSLGFE